MKQIAKFIITCVFIISTVFAQDTTATYFEKGPDGMIRFYYDNDYFLIDKFCEFQFIERVAGFDISKNKFHGEFKDFDRNGRTILTGNYVSGSKEGNFKAYYPDGTLKWEATYVGDLPQGLIKYYYPDAKPMLTLTKYNNGIYINQFWDKEGKVEINNGEGQIDITLPIVGFTEHGFRKYNNKGKVMNGLPQGLWATNFIAEDRRNTAVPFMITTYENGLVRNIETADFFDGMLIDKNTLSFSPIEFFSNAELLQSKKCSFDEHTGFNNYIAQKFNAFLTHRKNDSSQDETITLTYTVNVGKNGVPYGVTIKETSRELSTREKNIFYEMTNQIPYYLPSFLDGKEIKDRLTIYVQIQLKGETIITPPVQIVREKGF